MAIFSTNITRSFYRSDINGLRALSVVAVLFNHIWPSTFHNGYLGVDIFFFISGYVISSSLYRRNVLSNDTIGGFYKRRFQRIFPPLFFMIAITYPLSIFLIPPSVPTSILAERGAIASIFGVSNLYYYKQSLNYFGPLADLNPFTHTWSLGVEEQFYLLFPLLFVYFLRRDRLRRYFSFFLGLMFFVSLLCFVNVSNIDQPASYFLPQYRAFEFIAGSLLYLMTRREYPTFFVPLNILSLFSLLFTVFLCFSSFDFSDSFVPHVLVVLSVFVVCASSSNSSYSIAGRLLSLSPFVFLGLVSYSLYLWHWPIIVFSRYMYGTVASNLFLQLSLIFLLSFLSYHFIEKKLCSYISSFRARDLVFFFSFIAFAFSGLVLVLSRFGTYFYLGQTLKKHEISKSSLSSPSVCPFDSPLIFVGDSHASHLVIDECLSNDKVSVAAKPGTPFPSVFYANSLAGRTIAQSMDFSSQLTSSFESLLGNRLNNVSHVVLSSRLNYYFSFTFGTFGHDRLQVFSKEGFPVSKQEALTDWVSSIELLSSKFPKLNFVVVLPVPTFDKLYPEWLCSLESFRPTLPENCFASLPLEFHQSSLKPIKDSLLSLSRRRANVSLFDPSGVFCDANSSLCSSSVAGQSLYSDDSHLSRFGALRFNFALAEFLEKPR